MEALLIEENDPSLNRSLPLQSIFDMSDEEGKDTDNFMRERGGGMSKCLDRLRTLGMHYNGHMTKEERSQIIAILPDISLKLRILDQRIFAKQRPRTWLAEFTNIVTQDWSFPLPDIRSIGIPPAELPSFPFEQSHATTIDIVGTPEEAGLVVIHAHLCQPTTFNVPGSTTEPRIKLEQLETPHNQGMKRKASDQDSRSNKRPDLSLGEKFKESRYRVVPSTRPSLALSSGRAFGERTVVRLPPS